jgi:subtilisin family serine protease
MPAQMQASRVTDHTDSQNTADTTGAAESLQGKFDEFAKRAARDGSVRIIVGLDVDFQSEGKLSASARHRQRNRIKRAQNNLLADLSGLELKGLKLYQFIPFVALQADSPILNRLTRSGVIVSIEEDRFYDPALSESAPIVGATGGIANGFSGSGQTIAVLDSGISKGHSFFSVKDEDRRGPTNKIVSEACYSTNMGEDKEPGNSRSLCPDRAEEWELPGAGTNCDISDIAECFHGTHVAGIAAGNDVTYGRFGIAKDASLISVKIFSKFDNPADCSNTVTPCIRALSSDIMKGLERVYVLRTMFDIAAANLSLSTGESSSYCDGQVPGIKAAIDNLRSADIATIVSAGNKPFTSAIGFPACISTVISVGSTGDGSFGSTLNEVSGFSNSADILNLLAPGAVITSAVPAVPMAPDNHGVDQASGTSQAAPHVAGAWAILREQNPSASVSEILTALATTGRVVTDTRFGAGNRKTSRIRIDSASEQLAGTNCVRTPILGPDIVINAPLNPEDCSAEPGVNRDLYAFAGTAGNPLAISMSSTELDAYLYLLDPNGRIIAFDDNSGGGTDARIPALGSLTLPSTGSYTVIATRSDGSLAPGRLQNGNYRLAMLNPTAATVSVGGRVSSAQGTAVANAHVFLTGPSGEVGSVLTNPFGYFRFENVIAGEVYVLEIRHKRFLFLPHVIAVNGEITDLNFTADLDQRVTGSIYQGVTGR